jgi:hypothetical protein
MVIVLNAVLPFPLPKLRLPQQIPERQSHWDPLDLWPREYSILCQQWIQAVTFEYIFLSLWAGSCESLSLQPWWIHPVHPTIHLRPEFMQT